MPSPDGHWDWQEFAQTAQRLTRFDGEQATVKGFWEFGSWLWFFPWFVQGGVSFSDPRSVPLDSPEAIETMDFVSDLVHRQFVGWQGSVDAFLDRRSAMMHSGSWELKYWVQTKTSMGVTAPPQGPAGRATLANTDIIAINRDTRYPGEAWELLKWFYSRDAQRSYLMKFELQPARLSLGPAWIESVRELYRAHDASEIENLEVFLSNSAFAMPQPFFADAQIITQDIMPAINMIMEQRAPARSTLSAMAAIATKKLQQVEW